MPTFELYQQNIALQQDEQCYSRHLPVVLMLWLTGVQVTQMSKYSMLEK